MNSNYFNQAYYKDIPSSEVNWAQLAQQWIMSKAPAMPTPPQVENGGGPARFPFQPSLPSGATMAGGLPPPLLPRFAPIMPMSFCGPPPPFFGRMPGPIPPVPMPVVPPPGYFPPANAFQQNTDNEEYKAYYDRSLEQDEEPPPSDQSEEVSDAPAGAMSHWFNNYGGGTTSQTGAQNALPPAGRIGKEWIMNSWPTVPGMPPPSHGVLPPHFPVIGTEMRKRLPAWILEGLETAEKEKHKKQQKDEEKKRIEEQRLAKEAKRAAKGKGKFDSDSESDDEAANRSRRVERETNRSDERPAFPLQKPSSRSGSTSVEDGASRELSPALVELTPEERKHEALLATRRLMTIVLLDATDRQLERIVSESLANAKRQGADDEDEEDSAQVDNNANNAAKVDRSMLAESAKEKPKFSQNLASMLSPPSPEASEQSTSSSKKIDESKDDKRHKSFKSGSVSPDDSRHRFSSSKSHRHESSFSSSSRHHKSSRHSRDVSPLSKSRHRSENGGSGSKDRKNSRSTESSSLSKRPSDYSPTRHRSSSSSLSKKKRY